MRKFVLAFGLALTTIVSVSAQEAAVTEAVTEAAAAPAVVADAVTAQTEAAIVAAPVEGTVVDSGVEMTHTAAPAAPSADCGCGTAATAPVFTEAAPSVVEAAPACGGCAAPAPVASCGCEAPAPAPVATCGCEAPANPCCRQPRQRRYVVRSAVSSLRARRNCCCN